MLFACHRDGSGLIDRAEFEVRDCSLVAVVLSPSHSTLVWSSAQMAFYAADPVTGNSLGFQPSALLHPRDAFEVSDYIVARFAFV